MSKSKDLAKQLSEMYGIELSAAEVDDNGLYNITVSGKNETILDNQFERDEKIARVTIEEGVTLIGDEAFLYCTGLTSIKIPDGVISIGNEAFSGCTGLTSAAIPDSATSIDYNEIVKMLMEADGHRGAKILGKLFSLYEREAAGIRTK